MSLDDKLYVYDRYSETGCSSRIAQYRFVFKIYIKKAYLETAYDKIKMLMDFYVKANFS